MYVVFYGNRWGGASDRLIRWWAAPWKYKLNGDWRDMFSHVEIVFSDGQMFSASQYENRTRFKRHSFTGRAWFRAKITVTHAQERLMRNEAIRLNNKKYDYPGVIGFVLPFIESNKDKYFCSEVVRDLLVIGGVKSVNSKVKSSKFSPTGLALEIGLVYNTKTKIWEYKQ